MVKMSQSGRKKPVPSKVKVKVQAPRDVHMSDANSEEDLHEPRVKVSKKAGKGKNGTSDAAGKVLLDSSSGLVPSDLLAGSDWLGAGYHQHQPPPLGLKKGSPPPPPPTNPNNNVYSNGKHSEFREQSSPLSLSDHRTSGSSTTHEVVHDETSSNGNKDDEDDDDDDSEDKMDTQHNDPERLKAFNMFVRLFVDENLDRMVPISKQPKEKIQAIIDSCTRQFPEFAERARKRIRTYLKSCRRNKRARDNGGWDSSRPTPAHLTSVQAEQILAQACENESQNAKRMRMGLEPLSQPHPMPLGESRSSKENGVHHSGRDSATPEKSQCKSSPGGVAHSQSSGGGGGVVNATTSVSSPSPGLSSDGIGSNPIVNGSVDGKSLERSPLVDYSRTLNGNGVSNMSIYRPNFGQPLPRAAPFPSLFPPATAAAVAAATEAAFSPNGSPLPITNGVGGDAGPTDLSMKNKPLLAHKLNPTELATVRQLITGYRESAAFLLRSADELEQLLIQQQ